MKHRRHKFTKDSVEIKEMAVNDRYQKFALRKIMTYKCECGEKDITMRRPSDDDILFDFYYSDPI